MRPQLLAALMVLGCSSSPAPAATVAPTSASASTATSAPELPGGEALSSVAWLAGTHRDHRDDRIVEEVWTQPGGDTMFGVGRTLVDGKLAGFEFLRIDVRDGQLVYTAHPGGRSPGTSFVFAPALSEAPDLVVFTNPDHDFPTRVSYRRIDEAHIQARAENDEHRLIFDYERVP